MKTIPTAEEFYLNPNSYITKKMIEFAKLHVEAALENAYDCHTFKGWTNSEDENVHKELFVKNIMARRLIK